MTDSTPAFFVQLSRPETDVARKAYAFAKRATPEWAEAGTLTPLRETMANARRQLSAEDTQGRCFRFNKLTGPSILGPEFVVTVER
jgi:hypothetical protein